MATKKPTHTEETIELFGGRTTGNSDVLMLASGGYFLIKNGESTRGTLPIYEEMLLDDKISQVMRIVNSSVLSLMHQFKSEDKLAAEFVQENFDLLRFDDWKEDLLEARSFGYSVQEKIWGARRGRWWIDRLKMVPHDKIDFEVNQYGNLEHVLYHGKPYHPNMFHVFTYPRVRAGNFYGQSDLRCVYREYYSKKVLKQYRNIGLENFGFPVVVCVYDEKEFPKGSAKYNSLMAMIRRLKDDSRIALPGKRAESGEIMPGAKVEFLQPNFSGGGFSAFKAAIDDEDKAIARNLGLPDDLGFSTTGTGSNAKARTQLDMYWDMVIGVAKRVQWTIQTVVNEITAYNFPDAKVQFCFDFESDNGLTEEKARIIQGLSSAGIVIPDEFLSQYLGFEATIRPMVVQVPGSYDSKKKMNFFSNHGFKQYDQAVNYARIEKALDGIEDEYTDKISGEVQTMVDIFLKKLDKLNSSDVTVEKLDGSAKSAMKKMFTWMMVLSYFKGREESLLELEKKGVNYSSILAYRKTESFASADSGSVNDWVTQWCKDHGVSLNRYDKDYIARVKDWSFSAVQDVSEDVARIIRSELMTQVDYKNPDQIAASVMKKLDANGYIGKTPYQIRTTIRTSSSQFFNNARMSTFQDPDIRGYIVAYQYSAVLDSRTTFFCQQHHGEVIAADDPRLVNITPPAHFNCRSILVPITRDEEALSPNWGLKPMVTRDAQEAYTTPAEGFGGTGTVAISKAESTINELFTPTSADDSEIRYERARLIGDLEEVRDKPALYQDDPNGLEDYNVAILRNYTGDGYYYVNQKLRTHTPGNPYLRCYRDVLTRTLDKLPDWTAGGRVVYRRSEVPKEFLSGKIGPGDYYYNQEFWSSDTADAFDQQRDCMFIIKPKTGKHVRQYNVWNEDEVLFKTNRKFLIEGIDKVGNLWYIKLVEE